MNAKELSSEETSSNKHYIQVNVTISQLPAGQATAVNKLILSQQHRLDCVYTAIDNDWWFTDTDVFFVIF